MSTGEADVVDLPRTTRKRRPPPPLKQETDMAPIESVTQADFDKTAPYTPHRELTEAAGSVVALTLRVEGLGALDGYELRVEMAAFEDNLRAVAQIVYSVHAAMFAVNWGPDDDDEGGG